MVFKPSGYTPPPGIPEPETPPPEADRRPTRQIMLDVEAKLDRLLKALDEEGEELEEPEARTLDGDPAGRARDQTQSLG